MPRASGCACMRFHLTAAAAAAAAAAPAHRCASRSTPRTTAFTRSASSARLAKSQPRCALSGSMTPDRVTSGACSWASLASRTCSSRVRDEHCQAECLDSSGFCGSHAALAVRARVPSPCNSGDDIVGVSNAAALAVAASCLGVEEDALRSGLTTKIIKTSSNVSVTQCVGGCRSSGVCICVFVCVFVYVHHSTRLPSPHALCLPVCVCACACLAGLG